MLLDGKINWREGSRGRGWGRGAVDIQKKVEMVNINQNIISGTEN